MSHRPASRRWIVILQLEQKDSRSSFSLVKEFVFNEGGDEEEFDPLQEEQEEAEEQEEQVTVVFVSPGTSVSSE